MSFIHDVVQLIMSNTYLIGVLALCTMGITLTFKTANVANFAQAIVATTGAYTAGWLVRDVGLSPWLAMLLGVVVCFIIGFLLDAVLVRHIGGGNSRAMITIALIVLFTAALPMVFGTVPYNFPRFFTGQFEFKVAGSPVILTQNSLFTLILSGVVILVLVLALTKTKWGLGVRSTASNMYVASMMGVNVNLITSMSWAIASALGALGAILLASQTQTITTSMLGNVQTYSLLAFVFGGFTSFYGPGIAAVIVPIVLSLMALISGIWATALVYAVVMIVILIKPAGLFGKATIKKV